MRRISEIICESVRACFEMCEKEHYKWEEYVKDKPNLRKIAQADFLTGKNNEVRHDTWNDLNEALITIIKEKKYNWEEMETCDWDDLKKCDWNSLDLT